MESGARSEEAVLRPEYADTFHILSHSADFLKDRDEELELADHVIFPSDHVRRTLGRAPVSAEKFHKVPYGTDESKGSTRVLGVLAGVNFECSMSEPSRSAKASDICWTRENTGLFY